MYVEELDPEANCDDYALQCALELIETKYNYHICIFIPNRWPDDISIHTYEYEYRIYIFSRQTPDSEAMIEKILTYDSRYTSIARIVKDVKEYVSEHPRKFTE